MNASVAIQKRTAMNGIWGHTVTASLTTRMLNPQIATAPSRATMAIDVYSPHLQ